MKSIAQYDETYKNVCCIYKIVQFSSGKKYIGSTNNANGRRLDHYRDLKNNKHCNPHLQNSWNKYGENDFGFEILEKITLDIQFEREQWYLDNEINWDNDFNSNKSATLSPGTKGQKQSEETKRKRSIALKGKIRDISDEERKRRSDSAKLMNARRKARGWTLSKESRKKKSEISKKLGLRPPVCSRSGSKHSDESKKKISEASKKMWDARRNKCQTNQQLQD